MLKTKIILLSLVVLISGCSNIIHNKQNLLDKHFKAQGAYKGIIVSSGIKNTSLTNIFKSKNNEIIGSYYYIENSTKVSGRLYNCNWQSPIKLKCRWKDRYGVGDLLMTFNESYTEFNGVWNARGGNDDYSWTGSK